MLVDLLICILLVKVPVLLVNNILYGLTPNFGVYIYIISNMKVYLYNMTTLYIYIQFHRILPRAGCFESKAFAHGSKVTTKNGSRV